MNVQYMIRNEIVNEYMNELQELPELYVGITYLNIMGTGIEIMYLYI